MLSTLNHLDTRTTPHHYRGGGHMNSHHGRLPGIASPCPQPTDSRNHMVVTRLVAIIAALSLCAALAIDCCAGQEANPTRNGHAGQLWVPAPDTTWQWQLTTPVDTDVDAQVFDIDGTDNGADVVRALHAKGRKVICYINVGAAERFRPDYPEFPASILGKNDGWPGERWLDIRQRHTLRPIMVARFDMCSRKGFDAIEADVVAAYRGDTGFLITTQDQLAYNRMLADLAHQRGLSIGLKNDLDQVSELLDDFEFAVNEQCVEYHECQKLSPFIRAKKAVFHVEYHLRNADFCPQAKANHFSSMRKNLNLDARREPC